jgi:hypothetical protein
MRNITLILIGVALVSGAIINVNLNSQNSSSNTSLKSVEALTTEIFFCTAKDGPPPGELGDKMDDIPTNNNDNYGICVVRCDNNGFECCSSCDSACECNGEFAREI